MRTVLAALTVVVLCTAGLVSSASASAPAPAAAPAGTAPRAGAPYTVTPFRPRASDDDRLERAWRTWTARTDHRRYSTVVQQSCYCPPRRPVVTTIVGRRVTSVTRQGRTAQLARHGYEAPELFRILREGYRTADSVGVRYRGGVPVSIRIDYDEMLADEELALSVTVRAPAS